MISSPNMSSPVLPHQGYSPNSSRPSSVRKSSNKQRFLQDLSLCLFDFVFQLLPTPEEMAMKEDVRKLLERLIRMIEPNSRLLSFGSTANGFSLRNSDMDLCCLIESEEPRSATELVMKLGDLLERETKFHVKPLAHARIPIVKLSLDPSPGLPLGIACDIGFENRLALENTRLLMCYAMIDPNRVRAMVLFLKVWSKRRKINSPYLGTLSSYGYVLLVIYFLVHVKNPQVLPNLQQMPPMRPITQADTHLNGHNTWFFDDIELLRQRWQSPNTDSVAELLIDFFKYYSRDFLYNTGVASIRAGLLRKSDKGWQNELTSSRFNDSRERNRFCIEDPFELDYNVARCVTKDGLYLIRGEFMRAVRVLAQRPERAISALTQLCEERIDVATNPPPAIFVPPKLSSIPPQTPYTIGSNSTLPARVPVPVVITKPPISPPSTSQPLTIVEPKPKAAFVPIPSRTPPEHMAPRRSMWTSPPPPEAPPSEHIFYKDQLDHGLELATASTDARELEDSFSTASSESEMYFSDDGMMGSSDVAESDDGLSVVSFTEGAHVPGAFARRPRWSFPEDETIPGPSSSSSTHPAESSNINKRNIRIPPRVDPNGGNDHPPFASAPNVQRHDGRRSSSGPPRTSIRASWFNNGAPIAALLTPLPQSPVQGGMDIEHSPDPDIFYDTSQSIPRASASKSVFARQQEGYSKGNISAEDLKEQQYAQARFADELASRGRTPVGPHTPTATSYTSTTPERPTHVQTDSGSTVMSKDTPTKKTSRSSWMWSSSEAFVGYNHLNPNPSDCEQDEHT